MANTLFQKIIDRQIPADIIFEDDLCMAFRDVNPQAPTHVLLIPKKPIPKLSDVAPEDQELLGHLMMKVKEITEQLGISDAYRIAINNGAKAGQTVFHLHLHILSGRSFTWPPG